ncbi:MAG: hypothetical protein H6597_01490 [Flavobacteriales bacterium]|nr:hypothetical protein [Flavobacteriales bacterium]MCB9193180.1 hypothetical protein [Flavobacteriales bacterium]
MVPGKAMERKRRERKRSVRDLLRSQKRAAQKAAGALDGRFRQRVVKSARTYTRKRKHRGTDE